MVYVKVKIQDILDEHGISQRTMASLTGIRHAALSELSNSKRQSINFSHIERIAETFDISDIRKIIDLGK